MRAKRRPTQLTPERLEKLGFEDYELPTGRVLTWLFNSEMGTKPVSCKLKKVNPTDLHDDLLAVSWDLRDGSGVKVILDNHVKREPINVDWKFYLSQDHPDFKLMSDEQRKYYIDINDADDRDLIRVNDSMEESLVINDAVFDSIESSWVEFMSCAVDGYPILIDLSMLRPSGTVNPVGLVATGPLGCPPNYDGSFLSLYEAIAKYLEGGGVGSYCQMLAHFCRTIRKGSKHKDGIITGSIRYDHPEFMDFLNFPLSEIAGGFKKGARLDLEILQRENSDELLELIAHKHHSESLFLEKPHPTLPDYDLNVCVGIYLPDRGSCLLHRLNVAQLCHPAEIPAALVKVTLRACDWHVNWRKTTPDCEHYAPIEVDRQIAVDIMGLASALAQWGVKYDELNRAIERFLAGNPIKGLAGDITYYFAKGYRDSTIAADEFMESHGLPKLDLIQTIEPQQKSAFKGVDLAGFTTSRNIDPPFSRRVYRSSEVGGRELITYHPEIEIAPEIGHGLHKRFVTNWMRLMIECGRPHSISYDNWGKPTADDVVEFLKSPLRAWYYNFEHDLSSIRTLNKGQITEACDIGCGVCAD